nr:branched-chain amino acid ABC transporter permease [Marinitoga sp. 1138]
MKKLNWILNIIAIVIFTLFLSYANNSFDDYTLRIITLIPIYAIMAVSLNLINGITGIFSLGHAGFVLLGAYTSALLTLEPMQKEMSYIIMPIQPWLLNLHSGFLVATIAGGVIAAVFAFLIGWPTLKLSGDYLAIASLGFAEIARVAANNMISVTNGPLGLKGLPNYTNVYWAWGWLLVTLIAIISLVKSSYGRALIAIREDSIAAESMGINVFKHELLAFVFGAFFAGISGALYAHWLTTIDPRITTFGPLLTFYVLIMVVLGGLGSITGSVIGAGVFALMFEYLRALEEPFDIFGMHVPGIPGMRMLVISAIFIFLMIFWQKGIMGRSELTWERILKFLKIEVKKPSLAEVYLGKEGDE